MAGTPDPGLGFEQVCWVRLVHHPAGLRAEVAGVLKRRPVVRRVPVAVAAELVGRGVPVLAGGTSGSPAVEVVRA